MTDDVAKNGLRFERSNELEAWLSSRPREDAIVIAARAALRVLPFAALEIPKKADAEGAQRFARLTSALLRATAIARASAAFLNRANKLRSAADAAANAARAAYAARSTTLAVAEAAEAAAYAARAAYVADADEAVAFVARAADANAAAYAAAFAAANAGFAGFWRTVELDTAFFAQGGWASQLAIQPLWPASPPRELAELWSRLKATLPEDEDWDVWTRWYDERLTGGPSRGEAYELTFATVPLEVWDQGPAAANRWIKEHLPEEWAAKSAPDSENESALLEQKAAPFAFRIVDGKIDVAPEDADYLEAAAQDFYDEARRKAAELKERLQRAQADKRLQDSVARLEHYLGQGLEDIRPGLLLSALRSLESDHRAYDTEEGRKEHAPDLIAGLDDLAGSVRDLAAVYPKTREIVANQLALELQEEQRSLEAVEEASDTLAESAANHPEAVAPAAVEALREPGKAIKESRTLKDRAGQLALRLLNDANFVRVVISDFVRDSAKEIRKQAPKAVGKVVAGGITLVAALGAGHVLGHDGIALVKDVARAAAALNGAVGKPGGLFDKLSKKIEDALAKKTVEQEKPSPSKTKKAPAKKKVSKRTAAKK